MKKGIILGIVFLFVFMSFTSISGVQINYQIIKSSGRGNILYVGGSGPSNYSRIQDAIDNASSGDTIFVFDDSSPYYENVTINKSIQLIGENKETTIIDAEKNRSVIFIKSNNVTVRGFTLQNSGDDFYSGGVELRSNYNLITENIIVYNTNGVSIKNCKENTVSKNIISYNTIGIRPYNYYGAIYIKGSKYNNIIDNIIENNDNPGLFLLGSHYNEIKRNVISLNTRCGIRLGMDSDWKSNNNIFSENTIKDNTGWGITIGECSGNQITSNDFEYDSVDLYLSKNTLISKNNFISCGSTFSYIFDERKSYNNEWTSNYWNRPRYFPKLIKGDIGEVQGWGEYFRYFRWYQIDWNPAKEPYDINGSDSLVKS